MPLPTYFMSNFPSVRPSLNLQFDSQPTPEDMTSHLASVGATFSRASIGTYTDANGLIAEASAGQARPNYSTAGVHEGLLIEEARTNLIKASEDFSTTDWGAFNGYVIVNQAIAPDGLGGADKIIWTSDNDRHLYFHSNSFTNATEYTATYFVKADELDLIQIYTAGTGMNYTSYANFDLTNGTVTNGGMTTATIEDYDNGWYRISATKTANGTSTGVMGLSGIESTSDGYRPTFTGDNVSGLFVWGAQLEAGSFPTSYIPTIPTFSSRASTATYFDSDGVLQTASIDEARTDHKYIDGQWLEAGLLLEGASTNLVTHSEEFNNPSWTKTNTTISTNSISAPDGNTTADKASPDTSQGSVYQALAITSSTTYTYSVYLKKAENDFGMLRAQWDGTSYDTINFDLVNGTTSRTPSGVDSTSIEDVGNGWYRCIVTFTPSSSVTTNFQIRTSNLEQTTSSSTYTGTFNGTNGIYAWGAQVEAQSQATSYIPTTTATATRSADVYTTATKTRSADVCYIDGTAFTDFYNDDSGTFFVECIRDSSVDTLGVIYQAGDGTVANRIENFIDANGDLNNRYRRNNATIDPLPTPVTSFDDSVQNKIAFRYDQTSGKVFLNGEEVSSRTSLSGGPTGINELGIGRSLPSALELNGFIKRLIYFPRALQATEIQKLTR